MLRRLDKRVAEQFGLSRRQAQEAVRRGQVDVAGHTCLEPGREIEPVALLSYFPNRPRRQPAVRRLSVLYEDRHILIVDKPAGLLTQPTPARERDTLLERAGRYLARSRGVTHPYVGIVHRLDRDSSGVLLVVRSPRALRPFQALFRSHDIERLYVAIVAGVVEPPRGTIDLPLAADRGDGRRRAARPGERGLAAVTHYETIAQFGAAATQLACRLETGRTHQIRILLAAIGHAFVGDLVYRPKALPPFPIAFPRQALHALALGFVHPLTGQNVRVEAALPSDLTDSIAALRHRFGSRESNAC
jgi:23S rRNA pseudouridine1911/1915/1917 synthase